MIRLGLRPETPPTLRSSNVGDLKLLLSQKAERGEKIKSSDFYPYWSKPDVKQALWDMHHGKCCYCERLRDMKRESDVEHFRPKSEVSEDKNHSGYWWLAYEWDNYFLSCKKCNQEHKKTKFPLMGDGVRACTLTDCLESEMPYLINPEKDDPESYIGFKWEIGSHVKAIGLDDELRGFHTCKLLGLNEGTLPDQRVEILDELLGIVQIYFNAKHSNNQTVFFEYKEKIERQTSAEREFAGFRRYFFKSLGLYGNPVEN